MQVVMTDLTRNFDAKIHNGELRKVVLSGIPPACEGWVWGVYGIGVFLPILVMALGLEHTFRPERIPYCM